MSGHLLAEVPVCRETEVLSELKMLLKVSRQATFEILFDAQVIGKFQPATADFELFVSDTYTATPGSHKITVAGTNAKGGDNSGFVDEVKLLTGHKGKQPGRLLQNGFFYRKHLNPVGEVSKNSVLR